MRVLFPLVFVTCSSVVALRAAVPGGDDVLRNYYSLEVSLSLIYEPRTCPLLVMNREGVVVLVASCSNATVYVVMRTLLIRRLRPLTLPAQTNVGVGCAVRKVCGTDGVCLVEGCCGASLVHALSYGGRVLVFESWCLPRRGHFLDREARGKKRKVGNTRFQGLRRLEIWRSTAPAFFIGGASGELKRCFSTACASNFDTGRYQLSREAMVLRPPPPPDAGLPAIMARTVAFCTETRVSPCSGVSVSTNAFNGGSRIFLLALGQMRPWKPRLRGGLLPSRLQTVWIASLSVRIETMAVGGYRRQAQARSS